MGTLIVTLFQSMCMSHFYLFFNYKIGASHIHTLVLRIQRKICLDYKIESACDKDNQLKNHSNYHNFNLCVLYIVLTRNVGIEVSYT